MIGLLKKRWLAAALVFALSSFVFAETSASPLVVWIMDNGLSSQKAFHRIVKKYERETGTQVKVRVVEWGSAYNEITKVLAETDGSEEIPDIVQLGSTWVPHFAAAKLIRPLDFLMPQVDSSRFVAESFKCAHIAGEPSVYAVPWFLDVRALFVNERMWDSLGIRKEDVDSYQDLLGVLKSVAKKKLRNSANASVAPFALPGKNDWTGQQQMAPVIWSYGGNFIVQEGASYRSALLDSNTLKGLAIYSRFLGDMEISPQGVYMNASQNADNFVKSEQLMLLGSSEMIRRLSVPEDAGGLKSSALADDGLKVLPLPSGPAGKFSFVGGSHLALCVNRDSSKYQAAENLLVYLLRSDNIDFYSRQVGFLPADKGVIHIWNQDSRYSRLIDNLEHGRSFPNIPEWGSVESILIRMSNDMGRLFAESQGKSTSRKLAALVLDAHRSINAVLGFTGASAELENMKRIENFFLDALPRDSEVTDGNDGNQEILASSVIVALIAFFACLVVFAFVFCSKKKKALK